MREEGIVRQVLGNNTAQVECAGTEFCAKCGLCFKEGNKLSVNALNLVGAKAGDRVEIEIAPSNVLLAVFLIFIMPVLSLFAGYYAGGVTASFVFLFVYLLMLWAYDRLLKKKDPVCKIIKLLP